MTALRSASGRLQRQLQVGDQIVRMLDADRKTDRRFQNADALADVGGHAGMRHGGRMARKRFRAAETDRELEDLQRVQEFERGWLTTADVEREGRTGAGALSDEGPPGR